MNTFFFHLHRFLRPFRLQPLAFSALLAVAAGCNLQKDIDVELPAFPPQLVVECYLEPGQVPRMTVSETVPYLSSPTPTLLTDVSVVLTLPSGQKEAFRFAPGLDTLTKKLYTHQGSKPLVAKPGDTFTLDVQDTHGRHVTGRATMPARVTIDSLIWKFNDKPTEERRAYLLVKFQDPAATADFYRLQIHQDSISDSPNRDLEVDDRLTNGQLMTLGTSYRYSTNDTLLVTLYHLDQPYFRFLQSVDDAQNANGNPFAQPAAVKSTVEGGVGVFTILSYHRRRIIIR
ncbi:DUF4249 domain-containing protein [Hymenobacter chitinivorans]|uniref:Uncharacterized protein DUF4249 n=1 Tax=Hymenobacter chitinivorans DSM 11115 TaxID=1121954 RepID=A0A2M9BMT2_9BACT|nr:DUF4249 domain-containing protein [Hymenobacter chitinivorans]PJJ59258.1 uncharacterized protein DUF4249 [Hymenobacter chitinivorans DSM 11115]